MRESVHAHNSCCGDVVKIECNKSSMSTEEPLLHNVCSVQKGTLAKKGKQQVAWNEAEQCVLNENVIYCV